MASTEVRKHRRVVTGRKRIKRFTLVFNVDIAPIREPGKSCGRMEFTMVLRATGKTFAAAMQTVNEQFDQPRILAAFDGWPKLERGEEITSREDVVKRYQPG